MASRVYGIDLGTTYSCISYVDESGRPVVLSNAEGEQTTPSVVCFENTDNIVVGSAAKNSTEADATRVASFVKRYMGDSSYTFDADGKKYTPEEVSSLILRKLVQDAGAATGETITDVVITCPAYFGAPQREATKNAGKLAGLNVKRIIDEPVAAAISYGFREKLSDEVALVYDLGGGTFDVTVMRLEGGDINVVCTGGDHHLGGKDWDERIVNYLVEEFIKAEPGAGDPRDDPQFVAELLLKAEGHKRVLSSKDSIKAGMTYGSGRAQIELTREKFEELTRDLTERTIELTQNVLQEAASKGVSKIDKLLLVGGSSRMPIIAQRVKETFSLEPQLFEPDLAVAKGAALMAISIEVNEGKKFSFPTPKISAKIACSHALGVVVVTDEAGTSEEVVYLIHQNTSMPAEVVATDFGTHRANQTTVDIRVMESNDAETPRVDGNHQILRGEIANLPPNLPKGSPIHVTFGLRDDATLHVRAIEPSSGRDLVMNVSIEGVLSDKEVEEKRRDLIRKNVS